MKIIIFSLFTIITLYSCTKENLPSQKKYTSLKQVDVKKYKDAISVSKGILNFKTFDSYKQLIDNIEDDGIEALITYVRELEFISLENTHDKNNELTGDELLDAILNSDKVIEIDKWLIKIDIPTETVTAIKDSVNNAYQLLLSGKDKRIKRFSTGDDVIFLLEKNIASSNKYCGGVSGGTYSCYPTVGQGQIIKTFSDGVVWRLNPFASFFRAGIWFRLSSQYEIWRFPTEYHNTNGQIVQNISGNGLAVEMFIKWPQMWRRRRPCRSNSIGTKPYGFHYSNNTYGKYKRTVYGGIRNLNGYYFFVQGRAKYSNGTVTNASPYGGRNINSPY